MKEHTLEREQFFPLSVAETFAPYADAGNLQEITPPWLKFRIISDPALPMEEGAIIEYWLRLHGIPIRWRTRIETWDPPYRFTDMQVRGPFALWHHTHSFEPVEGGTIARDRVRYRVGFGPLGTLAHHLVVRRDVERIFEYRRDAILRLLTDGGDRLSDDSASGMQQGPAFRWAILAGIGLAAATVFWRARRDDRAA